MNCCFLTLHTTPNPMDKPTIEMKIRLLVYHTSALPLLLLLLLHEELLLLVFMASLLPTTLQQNSNLICFSPSRPLSQTHLWTPSKRNPLRCNAFLDNISLDDTLHLDQTLSLSPVFQSGYAQFQRFSGELPETEKWGILVFGGIIWIYLTARPGVLIGAIDAYILAPLQKGVDSLLGKRSLKRSDFLIGDKLGEGSFGVVYSGVIVPKNVTVEERARKRGNRKSLEKDARFKEKVILKKVKTNTLF